MRISERHRYNVTGTRIETAKSNNAHMLEQISTQKRVNNVSDDPVGSGQMVKHRSRLSEMDQFVRNIEFSKGYLERTESAVQGIHDNLIRAKELAVGLSSSTYDAKSREAAAREIAQIMDAVVALGNTTYGNRYVFGGFRSLTPPVSIDGQFLGDDGAIYLQIEDGTFRQINIQARNLFEADVDHRAQGHFNMLECLNILREGLESDDVQQIRLAMDELDYQMEKSSSYQATLGAIHNSLEGTRQRLALSSEITKENLSNIEDVDMYRAASDFKRTEAILQSTLLASNKLLQPSLLNFMQ